jgi:hypothetical protein
MGSRDWIQTGADGGGEKPDCRGNGGGRGKDSNDSSTLIILVEHLVCQEDQRSVQKFRQGDDGTWNATAGAILLLVSRWRSVERRVIQPMLAGLSRIFE